jgi:hypothetical protein
MRDLSGGKKKVAIPIFPKMFGSYWKIVMLALKDPRLPFQTQMLHAALQLVSDKNLNYMPMYGLLKLTKTLKDS